MPRHRRLECRGVECTSPPGWWCAARRLQRKVMWLLDRGFLRDGIARIDPDARITTRPSATLEEPNHPVVDQNSAPDSDHPDRVGDERADVLRCRNRGADAPITSTCARG